MLEQVDGDRFDFFRRQVHPLTIEVGIGEGRDGLEQVADGGIDRSG